MKQNWLTLFIVFFLFWSCQNDDTKIKLEREKETKKLELVFANIDKNWNFSTNPINTSSQVLTQNWAEWRVFLKELSQKPKSSIGAFQKKAKTLSLKALELNNNIPSTYNKPEIKSRIATITTKINELNLYINLKNIPDQKIIKIIPEINQEIQSLQMQFAEIDTKNQIKMEDGEIDMIRMLDTTRAISVEKKPENNVPQIQQNQYNRQKPFIPISK